MDRPRRVKVSKEFDDVINNMKDNLENSLNMILDKNKPKMTKIKMTKIQFTKIIAQNLNGKNDFKFTVKKRKKNVRLKMENGFF